MKKMRVLALLLALALLLSGCVQEAAAPTPVEPTAEERYATAARQLDAGLYYAAATGFEQIADHADAAQMAEYAHACLLLEDGFHAQAGARFAKLTVRDSAAQAALCAQHVAYDEACALLEKGDLTGAQAAFTALGEFGDSQKKAAECGEKLSQAAYDAAAAQLTAGDFAGAEAAFAALGEYADAAKQSAYARACLLLKAGDAAAARALLADLAGVRDADALLAYCDADALAQAGDAAGAEAAFAALTVLDSHERALALRFERGKAAYAAEDYVLAAELFGSCEGWSDSHVRWQMSVYQQAQDRMAHRDVEGAKALLEQIPAYSDAAAMLSSIATMNVDKFRHTYYPYGGFSEGLARVQDDDTERYGFIDPTGYLVVPCTWKNAGSFSEGLAPVQADNGLYGFIDKTGKVVIPCQYTHVGSFEDGVAAAEMGGKTMFINHSGEATFTFPEGVAPQTLSEGLIVVCEGEKYGCIDVAGTQIIPCEWDYMQGYAEGLCYAEKDGKKFFLNTDGTVAFELQYTPANTSKWSGNCFVGGMLRVYDKESRLSGYVDKTGALVVPMQWDAAYDFSEGLAAVKEVNGLWGYIDQTGAVVIPCQFESAGAFICGRSTSNLNGKKGYIDQTGAMVFVRDGYEFEPDGVVRVKSGWWEEQYVDLNGNAITPAFEGSSAPGGGYIILYDEDHYVTIYDYQGNRVF